MGVGCASCGQVIPSGQFRCGHCGAAAKREDVDDYAGLGEVEAEAEAHGDDDRARPSLTDDVPPPAATPRASLTDEEDGAAREPLVPRGTFASEVPERGGGNEEREGGRADASPRGAEAAGRGATAKPSSSASTSQRVATVRAPARPPYLASEILREDLTPSEPGKTLLRTLLYVAPGLGIAAALLSGAGRSATWVGLTALTSLLLLGRFELSYATRALLVAVAGGGSLAIVSAWRMTLGGGVDGPLLAATVTLLSAALLFRAWYRASNAARALVTGALALAVVWGLLTSHRELLSLVFSWESWLPALTWCLFGILCLLSLLAFMGDETTAGCHIWGLGALAWYGLFAIVRFALEARGLGGPVPPNLHTLGLIEPALAAPTAVALAQLFARLLGAPRRRATVARSEG